MQREKITQIIGEKYKTHNTEEGEFNYSEAFKGTRICFRDIKIKTFTKADMRYVDDNRKVAIIVETKNNFDKKYAVAKEQLDAYMMYEYLLTGYHIIGILANINDDRIRVWKYRVNEENQLSDHLCLKSFEEYSNILNPIRINDKEKVIKSTYELNNLLHTYGISEDIRSQYVGTCLLSLQHNLAYSEDMTTNQIIEGIRNILKDKLVKNINKAQKIVILDQNVLNSQCVQALSSAYFVKILDDIKKNILPYINSETSKGQDILNLFFTTFNKYVGKKDKNQAFTPDHIVHFMCKIIGINRNSKVLDPCCGSGAFLVRAMTEALNDCQTDEERKNVTDNNINGIEYEEKAFGLATTNMLIHSDGNTNILQGSCFEKDDWIKERKIDCVLMNPPYNAQPPYCKEEYVKKWKKDKDGKIPKQDPSKGFHYVKHIANLVGKGKLAVLLPMQCAIGNSGDIKTFKEEMLAKHHLEAVFSLPPDIFHPGANVNVCCMVFNLGIRHSSVEGGTFFGYYKDDGFRKKKYLGRIERINPITGEGMWNEIEKKWIETYRQRKVVSGLSAIKKVSYNDEWLCEAYMKTDYNSLSENEFEQVVRDYVAYTISSNNVTYEESENE